MNRIAWGLIVVVAASISPASTRAAEVSKKVADTWPAKWCQAQPGATADSLVTLMGPPSWKTDATMTWAAHQHQFNAFLEPNGTIRQLDINLYRLSDAEKAALTCAAVRTKKSAATAAPGAAASPDAGHPPLPACQLVTASEMTAILGAPVATTADGDGKCTYQPGDGSSPYVELTIARGDGEVAMSAVGAMAKHEPGIADPYAGLGDQAAAVGPALMIRTGEDLMTIVFSGVDGAPAKARKIFDTAKARM
ncbi:MAG: hypothetical protein IPK07_17310 [Deltaproteobacteria bacterium]|nr:hypothetical protein [Deltaproteobacteria bacterium]